MNIRIVNRVNRHARPDIRHARRQRRAALDAVQPAAGVDGEDKVGARVAVERLLDGDAAAAHGVDLEGAGELVDAGAVVVGVAALGAEVAIGAAGARVVAVGVRGDGEGGAADAAALAGLRLEARVHGDPVAALEGRRGEDGRGGREGGEEGLDEHRDGDVRRFEERWSCWW